MPLPVGVVTVGFCLLGHASHVRKQPLLGKASWFPGSFQAFSLSTPLSCGETCSNGHLVNLGSGAGVCGRELMEGCCVMPVMGRVVPVQLRSTRGEDSQGGLLEGRDTSCFAKAPSAFAKNPLHLGLYGKRGMAITEGRGSYLLVSVLCAPNLLLMQSWQTVQAGAPAATPAVG